MHQFTLSIRNCMTQLLPVVNFAASERSKQAIYKHVLIRFVGGKGVAIACNGQQSHLRTVTFDDVFQEPFSVCLDAVKFRAILMSYKDSAEKLMTVSFDDAKATVKVARSKLTVDVVDPNTFPSPDKLQESTFSAEIASTAFYEALKAASPCCADNDTRIFLNGCHVAFTPEGMLHVTGSDGFRMSRVSKPIGSNELAQGILPRRFLELVYGAMERDVPIRVRLNERMIEITWAGGQLRSSLIDAKYPDITPFFNGAVSTLFECNKADFFNCLNRLKATANEKLPTVLCSVDAGEVKLITFDEKKTESGTDYLPASVAGSSEFSLNLNFLLDVVGNIQSDRVSVGIGFSNTVRVNGVADEQHNTVIAQLRI